MKTNNVKLTGLIILLAIIFTACQENNQLNDNELNTLTEPEYFEGLQLVDGVFQFKDQERFSEFLTAANENVDFISEFKGAYPNFKSVDDKYNELTDDMKDELAINPNAYSNFVKIVEVDGEKYAEPIIEDKYIRSILNQEGIVKIGGEFTKVTYEKIYKSDDLTSFDNGDIQSRNLNGLKVINVERSNSALNQRMPSEDCRTDYNRRIRISRWPRLYRTLNFRFRGRIWSIDAGTFYTGIGANSTHYLKTAGIWYRDKAPRLSLEYSVTYTQYFQGNPILTTTESYNSGTKYNTRRIDETFSFL